MSEFEEAFGPDYLRLIPDSYWIHLGGRALETFGDSYPKYTAEQVMKNSPLCCARALSDTSHFHIDLHGNYIPGLCAGLSISMDDLGGPLPSGKYPLLERLTATGIRGLFKLAERSYGYRPQSNAYLNHCDLCTEIRLFLNRRQGQWFNELNPGGFYSEFLRR